MMQESSDESLQVVKNIVGLNPTMLEEFLEDPVFENVRGEIQDFLQDNT